MLVLEILAGRLLAPYVGVTLESFTGIIGVILAGIAAGSWLGGRLADRQDPRRLLGPMLARRRPALLSIPIVDYLGANMRGARPDTVVVLALAGSSARRGPVGGHARSWSRSSCTTSNHGAVVGRLSAVGTAGALVGTFVTGFVLVAAMPTRPIIRGSGHGGRPRPGRVAVDRAGPRARGPPGRRHAGVAVLAGLSFGRPTRASTSPPTSAPSSRRTLTDARGRVLWLDTLRHTYVDLDDPTHLEFTYAQTMSDVLANIAPRASPSTSCTSAAAACRPAPLPARHPTRHPVDGPRTRPAADRDRRGQLGLRARAVHRIVTGDARLNIDQVPDDIADLVIGDAFGGVSVPWHLTTREFLEEVRRTLRPGGWYALNLIDYPPLGFARAEVATLEEVFGHVAVLAPTDRLTRRRGRQLRRRRLHRSAADGAILERNETRGDDEEAVDSDGFASAANGVRAVRWRGRGADRRPRPGGPAAEPLPPRLTRTPDGPRPAIAADDVHVLVVGAGYAGVRAAVAARREGARVTLVDPTGNHEFGPRLAAVAGGRAPSGDGWATVEDLTDVEVDRSPVTAVDGAGPACARGRTPPRRRRGGRRGRGGHGLARRAGASEHALGLRTVADALTVRRELVEADRLVVVGGGPTGVQLAAEAAHRHRHLDVVLVEATPALLPAMPARLGRHAEQSCAVGAWRCGDAPRSRGSPRAASSSTTAPPSTGWSCGRPASPRTAVRLLPEAETIDGRLVVDSSLRVPGTIAVFAAGDMAAHRDLFALPMEMSAQTAVRAGAVAGRNAVRVARALPPSPALLFDLGRLVTMGRRVGVGTVLGLPLAGPLLDRAVPLLHDAVDLRHLFQTGGLGAVLRHAPGRHRPTRADQRRVERPQVRSVS